MKAANSVVVLSALAVAGCSGLTTRDTETVSYLLRPPATAPAPAAPAAADVVAAASLQAASLKVVRVVAQPGYAGDRLLLRGEDRSLGFYAASRWVDVLPAVVGSLAVESLRGTGRLRAVHDENAPFTADYTLRLTIRRFDAEYPQTGRPPRVTVGFEAAVGRRSDRSTVASFIVESQVGAADDRMQDVVAAFEQAAQQAFADLARRALEALEAEVAAAPVVTPPAVARERPVA